MPPSPQELGFRKTLARLMAVQALYAHAMDHDTPLPEEVEDIPKETIEYFTQTAHGLSDEDQLVAKPRLGLVDKRHFKRIMAGLANTSEMIDHKIEGQLSEKLSFNRLNPLVLTILRASLYECYAEPKVPIKTILSDYIRIADLLVDEQEVRLINGVLDKLAKQVRG